MATSVLDGTCPLEVINGKKPNVNQLRVFSCLGYANNLVVTNKFASRPIPCVLMGYFETQKGYKIYDLINSIFFLLVDM